MNTGRASNEQSGFTLIELLVVIAVIGILMAIIVPVTGTALENGRMSRCVGNMSQIYLGLQQYAESQPPATRDRLPYAFSDKSGMTGADNWAMRILEYAGSSNLFLCPSDPYSRIEGDRSYAVNAVRGGGQQVPFGSSQKGSPMRLGDLDTHQGDIILVSERPVENLDSGGPRGRMENDIAASLDLVPSTVHRKGKGGNYIFGSGAIVFVPKPDLEVKVGKGNKWTIYSGGP